MLQIVTPLAKLRLTSQHAKPGLGTIPRELPLSAARMRKCDDIPRSRTEG